MNPIPVIGIPYYNRPDLLARCISSIDYPVKNVVLVIQCTDIQNPFMTSDKLCAAIRALVDSKLVEKIHILNHPNAGVAGAWNEIIKLFPSAYWVLVNNDIQFAPKDLINMAAAVEISKGQAGCCRIPGIFYGNHGASFFAITDACIDEVGLFDENIYPAYLEDCDYAHRMTLLGMPGTNVQNIHSLHGETTDPLDSTRGSNTIHSDQALREKNGRTHGNNFEYYRSKWGGNNGSERFQNPFNDPNWPVWAWKFDSKFRAKNQW